MNMEAIKAKLPEMLIRHKNGHVTDNRVTNLQGVTFSEMMQHPKWSVDHCCYISNEEFLFLEFIRKRVSKLVDRSRRKPTRVHNKQENSS